MKAPRSVKEWIARAREAGHDALCIMCDPEALAVLDRMHAEARADHDPGDEDDRSR